MHGLFQISQDGKDVARDIFFFDQEDFDDIKVFKEGDLQLTWVCNLPPHDNAHQHPYQDSMFRMGEFFFVEWMKNLKLKINYEEDRFKGILNLTIHSYKSRFLLKPRFSIHADGESFELKNVELKDVKNDEKSLQKWNIQLHLDDDEIRIVCMDDCIVKDITNLVYCKDFILTYAEKGPLWVKMEQGTWIEIEVKYRRT